MQDLNEERPDGGPGAPRSSHLNRRRAALGYDARSERRSLRGAARRRKFRTRLWLVTVPAVVVIAVVVALLVVFGGPDKAQKSVSAVSTTVPVPARRGTLLVVEQGETPPVMVLLQSRSAGGVVLAIPGITLLKVGDSFQLVSALAGSNQKSLLISALGDAFGAQVGSVTSVPWAGLRATMVEAGLKELPPNTLTSDEGVVTQVAAAVLELLRGKDAGSASRWEKLPLSGDSSEFRAAVANFAAADGNWISAAVAGVQADGSSFLDPRADVVKALLASAPGDAAVTVEVQNGSGVIGITELAVRQLKPLGYAVSSTGNSDDFPGVEQTRIEVFPGDTETGSRVRAFLGTGTVTENDKVRPGHVVIVVGKDYVPPSSSSAGAQAAGSSGTIG